MKKLLLVLLISPITFSCFAQFEFNLVPSFEERFTYPIAKFSNASHKEVVRYTPTFVNIALKNHFRFTPNFSFSLNTGMFNHGYINNLNDTLKLKQRALAIPLGAQFTFGDVKGKNIFIGVEGHIPFHYKEKTWIIGDRKTKIKSSEWFSDKTEMFSPLVFLGVQVTAQRYIQVKYQLGNFLNPNYNFNFRGVNTQVTQSNVIELTFGTTFGSSSLPQGFGSPIDDSKDLDIEI